MVNPLQDDMPTTDPGYDDDDYDVVITYSDSNILEPNVSQDQYVSSARKIEGTILEERNNEFDVKLEIVDNTNRGMFAMGGSFTNYSNGSHEEFTEELTFKKSNIPYYQPDFPNVQGHIPKGERISPLIREWSDNEPFRA